MILINTRPKDLSGKINELCDQEGIGLQNIYLSKIIPIEIDTYNGVYKEIFENLDKYSNFIFTSQAAVKNGAKLIKLKSKLLNKKHIFLAIGYSTIYSKNRRGKNAIKPYIKYIASHIEFIFKNLNQDSLKNKFFVVASERIKSKIIDLSLGFNIKVFVSKSALDKDMIIKAKEFI